MFSLFKPKITTYELGIDLTTKYGQASGRPVSSACRLITECYTKNVFNSPVESILETGVTSDSLKEYRVEFICCNLLLSLSFIENSFRNGVEDGAKASLNSFIQHNNILFDIESTISTLKEVLYKNKLLTNDKLFYPNENYISEQSIYYQLANILCEKYLFQSIEIKNNFEKDNSFFMSGMFDSFNYCQGLCKYILNKNKLVN